MKSRSGAEGCHGIHSAHYAAEKLNGGCLSPFIDLRSLFRAFFGINALLDIPDETLGTDVRPCV
jgi:hypothetical protein